MIWVSLFYIFASIFGLLGDRFSYLLLSSICCDMLFRLKYVRDIQPLTDTLLGKREVILMPFFFFFLNVNFLLIYLFLY